MIINIYCDSKHHKSILEHFDIDICDITKIKWEASTWAIFILLTLNLYMLIKWRKRCKTTLLTFHNIRAAIALVLLIINTIELARAILATGGLNSSRITTTLNYTEACTELKPEQKPEHKQEDERQQEQQQQRLKEQLKNVVMACDQIFVVIGKTQLANAFTAIVLTILLMWYHRVAEIKRTVEFLYVSCTMCLLIFILRLYELSEIVYFDLIWELESCVQFTSCLCLLSIGFIDGFTVYKERYRPEYLSDTNKIGYKHSLATFYSKIFFWWLTPLLWLGFKKPLELNDLGQMPLEDSARTYYDQFLLIYKTIKAKQHDQPVSLWLCFIKSSWQMLILSGVLKLFGDLCSVLGPLAILQIVQYIEIIYNSHYNELLKHWNNMYNNTWNMSTIVMNDTTKDSVMSNILKNSLKNARLHLKEPSNHANDIYGSTLRNILDAKTIEPYETKNNNFTNNNPYTFLNSPNQSPYYADYLNKFNSIDYLQRNASSININDIANITILYIRWSDLLTNGWTIAWLLLLSILAQGALSHASTHIINMLGIRIKTSLQGLIYRKTLLLNSTWSCNVEQQEEQQQNEIKRFPLAVNTEKLENVMCKLFNRDDSNQKINDITKEPSISSTVQQISTLTENIKTKQTTTTTITTNEYETSRQNNHIVYRNRSHSPQHSHVNKNVGSITNLMSEDTFNVMSFFWIVHYIWSIPLKIAIIMYLLYVQLGISAIIGCSVSIISIMLLQFFIGRAMSNNAAVIASHNDKRLQLLYDMLLGIKLIKLNAWDQIFLKKLNKVRSEELKYLNKDSMLWTFMTILMHVSSVLIILLTLMTYVYLYKANIATNIRPSHLFTALALFQQLTVPLLIFPIIVPIILSAFVSTKRLQNFLAANEIHKQFEGIRNMARILSKSNASLDIYERSTMLKSTTNSSKPKKFNKLAFNFKISDKPAPLVNSEPQSPLNIEKKKFFEHDEGEEKMLSGQVRKELLRNTSYVVIRPKKVRKSSQSGIRNSLSNKRKDSWHRDSLLLQMPDDIAVSLKEAIFSWHPNTMANILYIKDLLIPKSKLTVIVGENGSGKSSLLYALLMEMPLISGDMLWNKTSTLAFVSQEPWLLNASIRENITFGETFHYKRYLHVLNVCALKLDIEKLPMGDLTIIGERGVNLSGGQKQRVAIARALYSSANVVIMDDPLASLDNEVAKHVFECSIGKMLLKAKRTVILVTQRLNLIYHANYLIVLKNGCLEASGSYADIKLTHPHIIEKWCNVKSVNSKKDNDNSKGFETLNELSQNDLKCHNVSDKTYKLKSNQDSGKIHENILDKSCHDDKDNGKTFVDSNGDDNNKRRSSTSFCNKIFKLRRTSSSIYNLQYLLTDITLPNDEYQLENVILRHGHGQGNAKATLAEHNLSSVTKKFHQNIPKSNYANDINEIVEATTYSQSNTINGKSNFNEMNFNALEENDFQQYLKRSSLTSARKDIKRLSSRRGQRNRKYANNSFVNTLENSNNILNGQEMTVLQEFSKENVADIELFDGQDENIVQSMAKSNDDSRILAESINEQTLAIKTEPCTSRTATIGNSAVINVMTAECANTHNDGILQQQPTTTTSLKTLQNCNSRKCCKHTAQNMSTTVARTTNEALVEKANDVHVNVDVDVDVDVNVEHKYDAMSAKVYLLYMKASGYTIVLLYCISTIIWQSLRLYMDICLQQWSDSHNLTINVTQQQEQQYWHTIDNLHLTHNNNELNNQMANNDDDNNLTFIDIHEMIYYFHRYMKITLACTLMAIIATPIGQWAGCRARHHFHNKLLHAIIHRTLHFFETTNIGYLINRFGHDMAIIDKKIAATGQRLIQFSLLCLCAVFINVAITYWFFIITIAICVSYYVIQRFYRCSARELQRIESATSNPILSYLVETIEGITTIRAYHQEARFTEIFFKHLEMNTIATTILNSSNRWLGLSLDYLGGILVFLGILTALLMATLACNQHMKQVITMDENDIGKMFFTLINYKQQLHKQFYLQQQQQQQQQEEEEETEKILLLNLKYQTLAPSPSLVGLTINYTLLLPIYLNWIVKLLADMDLYANSIQRIYHYIRNDNNKITTTSMPMAVKNFNANVICENNANEKCKRKLGQSCCELNQETITTGENLQKTYQMNTTTNENRIVTSTENDTLLNMNVCNDVVENITKSNEMNTDIDATIETINKHNHNHNRNDNRNDNCNDNKKEQKQIVKLFYKVNDETKLKENCEQLKNIDDNDRMENSGKFYGTNETMISPSTPPPPPPSPSPSSLKTITTTMMMTSMATIDDRHNNNEHKIIFSSNKSNKDHIINRNDNSSSYTDETEKYFHKTTKQTTDFNNAHHVAGLRSSFKRHPFTYICHCPYYYNASTLSHKQYQTPPLSWPQYGNIIFENVSLRYEEQHSPVIRNLSLTIPAGQKIVICGRTGSGKSSLVLSLFGVLQVFSGNLYIDDIDLSLIHPYETRNRLAIIPQNVHLFATTIKENLDPYGHYTDYELWKCLELVQLKEFITKKMPKGLDTQIGEGGLNLSVGQRQLLCLARAILRDAICLVLDEATSALDNATERTLLRIAFQAFQGRTIIIIAHRLINLIDCDRIIVLENGQIIEDGRPQQLQQHTKSYLNSLLKSEISLIATA